MKSKSFKGIIKAPPSKSYMQRALVLASLANSSSKIFNPASDLDSIAALQLIEELNCEVRKEAEYFEIIPSVQKNADKNILNCGESGLLMRMAAPVLSLFNHEFILEAERTLKERELFEIKEILEQLGAKVETMGNKPPLKIKGPIHSGIIHLQADKTSQFLTGLLIALPLLKEKSIVKVENLSSKPYIDLTFDLVKQFGGKLEWIDENTIEIIPSEYTGQVLDIEGDWSSAAVLLTAGAIAGEVTVTGLNLNSKQGDKAILDVLSQVGALIECHSEQSEDSRLFTPFFKGGKGVSAVIHAKAGSQKNEYMDSSVALLPQNDILSSVTIKKHKLKQFEYDAKDTPDLVPYLAVLAANCDGKSVLYNVSRLNLKESRRLDFIMKNLSLLGIICKMENDALVIFGGKIHGGIFETEFDHRMAMAGALASLTSEKEIIIDNPECVKKSYPNFWEDINKIM